MMVEEGYRCPTPGAGCAPLVCGDSRVDPPEQCDDNNAIALDGCSANCELEAGWVCLQPGVACTAAECGDGLVAGFEQCDDGSALAGRRLLGALASSKTDSSATTPGAPCEADHVWRRSAGRHRAM